MEKGNRVRRVEAANRLAEERYLNRNTIVENEFSHNGMAPFMNVHKDGTFSDADKEPVSDDEAVNEIDVPLNESAPYKSATNNELAQYIINLSNEKGGTSDAEEIAHLENDIAEVKRELESRKSEAVNEDVVNEIDMDIINAAGDWITGGGMTNVGGEAVPTNLVSLIMGLMPAAAATGFIIQFWTEIKAKLGVGKVEELSPAQVDADKSREKKPMVPSRPDKPNTGERKPAANASRDRR